MLNKKRFLTIWKLILSGLLLILVIYFTPIVFSKYESASSTTADLGIAFYVVNANYYTQTIQLFDIVPSATAYAYTFTVSNFEGNNRLETDLIYDLSIVATTNLPLEYELYLNEDYSLAEATNIITSDTNAADSDGSYFKTMITDTNSFGFTENETNTYTLLIYFPTTYISYEYQGIMESIEIIIDSSQVI
ncbi:MAG TPA: hypothetical protein PLT65_03025 [Bacilli bacterium]|nr:hypothetical protein [Bacilli bacterium]